MDRRIKFRHLEAFSAIARDLSLKRAAERLNLTQPAISRTLKELETYLDSRLMDRSRAGVRLTPPGEVFLQYAEQSMVALQQGLRSVQNDRAHGARLRIGALPSVASSLMVAASHQFIRAFPDIVLDVTEGPHDALIRALRSGQLDLLVGRLGPPETMDAISFRQLYSEEIVVVCRPDSDAVAIRDFAQLADRRVLYPPKNSAIRPLLAQMLISKSVPLFANRIESASLSFGRAMVLSDPELVWFISRGVVANDLAAQRMVALDLDMAATVGAVGIMSRSDEVQSAISRSFGQFLVNQAAQRHAGGASGRGAATSSEITRAGPPL